MEVSSPQHQRVVNLTATIGSFNDELRETNRRVEISHIERNELLKKIELLKFQLEGFQKQEAVITRTLLALEEEILSRGRIIEGLKDEESKRQEYNCLLAMTTGELYRKIKELRIGISGLSQTQKQVKEITDQVEQLGRTAGKLRKINNEEQKKIESLRVGRKELADRFHTDQQKIKNEKQEFSRRVRKLEADERKHNADLKNFIHLQARKEKDLRIVTARLKKRWLEISNLPFPRL